MSRTASATVRVTPSRMLCATRSGSYFSFLIAFKTRRRTPSLTDLWPFRTRDTVPMATFAASATSRIVGLPAIYAPQPTQWWLMHTKGKGAARARSLPLWSRDHNNFPKEVPRFHERFGVAQLGERKRADFGLLDFSVRHIDHSPPNILLGVA